MGVGVFTALAVLVGVPAWGNVIGLEVHAIVPGERFVLSEREVGIRIAHNPVDKATDVRGRLARDFGLVNHKARYREQQAPFAASHRKRLYLLSVANYGEFGLVILLGKYTGHDLIGVFWASVSSIVDVNKFVATGFDSRFGVQASLDADAMRRRLPCVLEVKRHLEPCALKIDFKPFKVHAEHANPGALVNNQSLPRQFQLSVGGLNSFEGGFSVLAHGSGHPARGGRTVLHRVGAFGGELDHLLLLRHLLFKADSGLDGVLASIRSGLLSFGKSFVVCLSAYPSSACSLFGPVGSSPGPESGKPCEHDTGAAEKKLEERVSLLSFGDPVRPNALLKVKPFVWAEPIAAVAAGIVGCLGVFGGAVLITSRRDRRRAEKDRRR